MLCEKRVFSLLLAKVGKRSETPKLQTLDLFSTKHKTHSSFYEGVAKETQIRADYTRETE